MVSTLSFGDEMFAEPQSKHNCAEICSCSSAGQVTQKPVPDSQILDPQTAEPELKLKSHYQWKHFPDRTLLVKRDNPHANKIA